VTEFEQKIVECVDKYGWFGLSVSPRTGSDDPEEWFTYTIGLPKSHDWPEIICFGLASDTAHGVLSDAITECENKSERPRDGMRLSDTLNGFDAMLVDASAIPDEYFGTATWYARLAGTSAPPARVQLLWPDKSGRFPNDPDCSPEVRRMQTPCETA
jgi:hypothetical protein